MRWSIWSENRNILAKTLSPVPSNSRAKPQQRRRWGRSQRPIPASSQEQGAGAAPQRLPQLPLGFGIPVRLERQDLQAHLQSFSSGCFSLVRLAPVPVRAQSCSAAIALGLVTAFKLPVPQSRDWLLFTRTICSGSCTSIVASKQSELEATLLSTLQMLSKKTVATQFAQSSCCGMQWGMFLGKLGVLPCFTGAETGCGEGWCASQRTCLQSPPPLCWTPLLCPPPQYNEQLSYS